MKKIIILLFCFLFFIFLPISVRAYDPVSVPNNIYGISIVNYSDLQDAANFINVNGGDWGYVTIVITEKDRNKDIWQEFLDSCRKLHIIPIIRVASEFKDSNWKIPEIEKIDSWVNFFNSLNWVTKNRYIIIGNEPNHAKEWGGKISPAEYAIYLKTFAKRLHNASSEYFVLNAGFDQDAPNSKMTMDEKKYIDEMVSTVPDIFSSIDGWSSHSYPNPAFSGPKTGTGRRSIKGYEWELGLIKRDLPIFITETGWIQTKRINEQLVSNNMKYAFENVWSKDKRIIAVTPFLLNYQGEPFLDFSWKKSDGSFFQVYSEIQNLQKIKGEPKQKISGEIVFNFLNPLMIRNTEQKGFTIVKNTGQATWYESDSEVINESNDTQSLSNEIKISNTKFNQIEPFTSGLVVYTLNTPQIENIFNIKLGFYVRGERIGDVYNGKIISF